MTNKRIVAFNFTWALRGGAWIRRANGDERWESYDALVKETGRAWIDYMVKKQGFFTGCWCACDDYANSIIDPQKR